MDGCESWTIKKAEWQRIDAFELWCWRRLLRVPWTAKRPNQSILKEISPDYSLEELMLKLQYFGHLMWRTDSFEKTLMLGKIEGGRRSGCQRMKWMTTLTRWTWVWVNSRSWWWTGRLGVLQSMQSQSRTQLSDWTELQWGQFPYVLFGYLSPFYPKGSSLLSFIALSWEAALGSFYTLFPNLVMVAYLYQKKWNMFQSHPTIDFTKGNGYMRALYHSSDSLY